MKAPITRKQEEAPIEVGILINGLDYTCEITREGGLDSRGWSTYVATPREEEPPPGDLNILQVTVIARIVPLKTYLITRIFRPIGRTPYETL